MELTTRARACLLAVVASAVSCVMPCSAEEAAFRRFESARGGFSVDVPAGWHVVEQGGEDAWSVSLSRERVEKEGDHYSYGLTVSRLTDWPKVLGLQARDPSEAALEYANQLAEGTGVVLDGGYDDSYGMDLRYFRIIANGEATGCVQVLLLVGADRKQWFMARWKMPCSEVQANEPELRHVRESLRVRKKWRPPSDGDRR